jgi:hypothetical protein
MLFSSSSFSGPREAMALGGAAAWGVAARAALANDAATRRQAARRAGLSIVVNKVRAFRIMGNGLVKSVALERIGGRKRVNVDDACVAVEQSPGRTKRTASRSTLHPGVHRNCFLSSDVDFAAVYRCREGDQPTLKQSFLIGRWCPSAVGRVLPSLA